ncbi:hypothetical protein [Enterobacter hormaechei]|uniref:hypothetical protein n=1 Tax=Enterobacter hormaechei TaxID=158836 RepID=UPI0006802A55|nr:hypothetical protein [Enterobacter hormaechei]
MTGKYVSELELGKCGEYYAIFKLAKQGFVCFPSDQGLPYDIVVETNGRLLKGQVRSTLRMRDYGKSNVFTGSERERGKVMAAQHHLVHVTSTPSLSSMKRR